MLKRRKLQITLMIVIFIHIIVCIFLGSQKHYLFTDEVFSYGLANSESHAFLDTNEDSLLRNEWVTKDYFSNYMKYNETNHFSFQAAFENQKKDVHPPLYYCLLHLICFFFQDTDYSVWPGLWANLVILVFLDVIIYKTAYYFYDGSDIREGYASVLAVVFWAFSSIGLSSVLFIRMYLLSTLEIMLFIAAHRNLFQKNINWKRQLILAASVCAGCLTHYYFYIFAAVFGLCICSYYVFHKRIVQMLLYGFSLLVGVGAAFLIFPGTWSHFFGYRGSYVTDHILGFASEKFELYSEWINRALFGNMGLAVIVLFGLFAIFWFISMFFVKIRVTKGEAAGLYYVDLEKIVSAKKTYKIHTGERLAVACFTVIAAAVYVFVAIQGSEIASLRYVYPVIPILAVLFTGICMKILPECVPEKFMLFLILILCVKSIGSYGIEWLYNDYNSKGYRKQADELTGKDAVIICRDNGWVNIYQGMNLYIKMDEIRCVTLEALDTVEQILEERGSDDDVVICFPSDSSFADEEKQEILNKIINTAGYASYDVGYDYITTAYRLLKE